MKKITHISARHKELGNCNSDELCKIISMINPEVIFLESFNSTYSAYSQETFKNFGVYHNKLEIQALQKYSKIGSFNYVPVLKNNLLKAFDEKYAIVCRNVEFQKILDLYNLEVENGGFKFLNSENCIQFHENMRKFENKILNNYELTLNADTAIDIYENEMLSNIYQYCKNNHFNDGIFMCGSAHRRSIIEKTVNNSLNGKFEVRWETLEY
ncbi:hypothetical protein EG349_20030 (plasmid) [Chryseobacterium shandongense]|jgi:hypothetical protein|uniref:Uncharacterized protein n=1 Tax=Chryseobacterium shandongense TaxID=1493872 RepID=A0AAD0YKZ2_9FLAO|nr:hypothetical protein [Chryseobacterium shandongense]AZA89116.1 hypothetical protein EG349_20030 [Chryseobacterium shandongense]AZA98036.1 hypothetical protein EG353_20835 [Chryseobacterium shandongense]